MKRIGTTAAAATAAAAAAASKHFRIQYASCLHANEDWRTAVRSILPPTAPTLALLGNCGSVATAAECEQTTKFLAAAAKAWKQVLWVPGPLELTCEAGKERVYTSQLDDLNYLARKAATAANSRVILLQQSELVYEKEGVVILGATGWSDCKGVEAIHYTATEANVFLSMGGGTRRIQPDDIRRWNAEDLSWLGQRLEWWNRTAPEKGVVVLSHHLPSGHLVSPGLPRAAFGRLPLDLLPALHAELLLSSPNLYAWLAGATGSSVSGFLRGSRTAFSAVNGRVSCPSLGTINKGFQYNATLEVKAQKPQKEKTETGTQSSDAHPNRQ